jgi:bifunctional non-homologous end joining protein LigD
MRLRLVKKPFDDPDYIFELKHDGFRAVVYLQDSECKIVSRNQRNGTPTGSNCGLVDSITCRD